MENLEEDYKSDYLDLNAQKGRKFERIVCPSCSQSIPAIDLNINDKIAKCSSCNSVFSFQETVLSMLQDVPQQELIRPEGIELFYFKDELDITVQQPITTLESITLMTFPFFTLLFTLGWSKGKIDFVIPAIFGTIALIGILSIIFRKRHKIYITVDEDDLSIQWRPRKFIKDKKYNAKEIDQLYINKGMESYQVSMILNTEMGQKHVVLLPGLKSISKAKFLEQEIEKHLRIKNRKVPGELS